MAARMTRCPKCNSESIFVRDGGVGFSAMLMVDGVGFGMKPTDKWETYLCTDCGYFENYLTHKEWLSRIKADPKKAEWRKPE